MSPLDISVSFPSAGVIRLRSRSLFGDAENLTCRAFLERVFQAEEISNVSISGGDIPEADLYYCPKKFSLRGVVQRVVALLGQGTAADSGRRSADHAEQPSRLKRVNEPLGASRPADGGQSSKYHTGRPEVAVAPVSSCRELTTPSTRSVTGSRSRSMAALSASAASGFSSPRESRYPNGFSNRSNVRISTGTRWSWSG
jgi:hypothetical protein